MDFRMWLQCVSVILFSLCQSVLLADIEKENVREGKFFVSTSTLTSIVTTTNQCYKAVSSQATGMMTCKKRKKRNLRYLNDQAVVNKDSPIFPSPSSKEKVSKEPNAADLAASYADARAARFVYYWATFTETSTSFSYPGPGPQTGPTPPTSSSPGTPPPPVSQPYDQYQKSSVGPGPGNGPTPNSGGPSGPPGAGPVGPPGTSGSPMQSPGPRPMMIRPQSHQGGP